MQFVYVLDDLAMPWRRNVKAASIRFPLSFRRDDGNNKFPFSPRQIFLFIRNHQELISDKWATTERKQELLSLLQLEYKWCFEWLGKSINSQWMEGRNNKQPASPGKDGDERRAKLKMNLVNKFVINDCEPKRLLIAKRASRPERMSRLWAQMIIDRATKGPKEPLGSLLCRVQSHSRSHKTIWRWMIMARDRADATARSRRCRQIHSPALNSSPKRPCECFTDCGANPPASCIIWLFIVFLPSRAQCGEEKRRERRECKNIWENRSRRRRQPETCRHLLWSI